MRSWALTERGGWVLLLAVLAVACFALPFVSSPGRFAADTRGALFHAPEEYLRGTTSVWQSSPYLGNEQHDGLLVPMGAVVWLLRTLGASAWVAERIWHGLLLFTAAAGMVVLVRTLRPGPLSLAHPVAAAAYAFNPLSLGAAVHSSGTYLAYFALPLLLAAFAWGLRRPRAWLGPCLVAVAAVAMGGGNGAPQVFAAVPLLAYLVWAVFVRREATVVQGALYLAKCAVLVIGVSAWWLVGLTSAQVGNDIAFSEQPATINIASSFSESLRLMGFWGFYGGDSFGAWYPTLRPLVAQPAMVLLSFVFPVAALGLGARSRWGDRSLFVILAVLSVAVMAGIFPPGSSSPFGRLLLRAYEQVPGAVGLRTTYKMGTVLALSLSLLLAFGVAEAWRRARGAWRWITAGLAALVVAVGSYPLWTGTLYPAFRTTGPVPEYWNQALEFLRAEGAGGRVVFVPGSLFSFYRWGGVVGGIPEITPDLSSVRRPGVVVAGRYANDYLAALEQPFQHGPHERGATATMLRSLGARYVVLQNDLDWERSQTARPIELQVLADEPGLRFRSGFGIPGQNVVGPGGRDAPDLEARLREIGLEPVQVFEVSGAGSPVRVPGTPPIVLSGDAFGIATLAGIGGLDDLPPVLYSGALSPSDLLLALEDGGRVVISDSNRRRVWRTAAMRDNFSFTLEEDEDLGSDRIGFELFGGRPETQTVAVMRGVEGVTASSYGSAFSDQPQFRPYHAFDGDRGTAWLAGGFSIAVREFVQVDLQRPLELSEVTLVPHRDPGRREVAAALLEFSDGSAVSVPRLEAETVVGFEPRTVEWLRVRVAGVTDPTNPAPVGFDEIIVPGVQAVEYLRLPRDLAAAAAAEPSVRAALQEAAVSILLTRARSDFPGAGPDEEAGIRRLFDLDSPRELTVVGSAQLDPLAPDEEIDRLLLGETDVTVASSGRLGGAAQVRGSRALDGDPDTAWLTRSEGQPWIEVSFPSQEVDSLRIEPATASGYALISRVRLDFSDGSSVERVIDGGDPAMLRFEPRAVDRLRLTITRAVVFELPEEGTATPVGIAELEIAGVEFPADPAPGDPLPCYEGPGFMVDGEPVAIQPSGSARRLLQRRPVRLQMCDESLELSSGEHTLDAVGVLRPSFLLLDPPGREEPVEPVSAPGLGVDRDGPTSFRIGVYRANGPFHLVLGEGWSPGWEATIDGESLGEPLVVDGYAAGWRIDRHGDFLVQVRYAPQARQDAAYLLSLATAGLVVLLGGLSWWRLRRRR